MISGSSLVSHSCSVHRHSASVIASLLAQEQVHDPAVPHSPCVGQSHVYPTTRLPPCRCRTKLCGKLSSGILKHFGLTVPLGRRVRMIRHERKQVSSSSFFRLAGKKRATTS